MMVKLFKNYISSEEAFDGSVEKIIYIVLAVVGVGVVGYVLLNLLNNGKSQAESGLQEYNGIVESIKGLH